MKFYVKISYNIYQILLFICIQEKHIFYDHTSLRISKFTEYRIRSMIIKMYFLLMHTQCVPIPYITSYAFANNRFAFSSWSGIRCFNLPSKLFQSCFDSLYSSSFSSSVFSTTFSFFPFF